MKFRKRPVVVEAILWTGFNFADSESFVGEPLGSGRYVHERHHNVKIITTLEGDMRCQPGDWIIKGVTGECYPIKPDIFEQTYERVEEP